MRKTVVAAVLGAVLAVIPAAAQTVRYGPPPPRHEVIRVAPGPRYVWVPGYYRWHRHAYVWVPGYYAIPPRPHAVWVPGYWTPRGGVYVWVGGFWR